MMMLRRSKVCVGATLDMGRRVATGTSTPSPPVKSSPMLSTATMKCWSAAAEPDVPLPECGFSPHERQRRAAATPAAICPEAFHGPLVLRFRMAEGPRRHAPAPPRRQRRTPERRLIDLHVVDHLPVVIDDELQLVFVVQRNGFVTARPGSGSVPWPGSFVAREPSP